MADIPKQQFSNAGTAVTTQATIVGGDSIRVGGTRTQVIFRNGHSSAITIAMAPARANSAMDGAGVAPTPTRSLALAAGAMGFFDLRAGEVGAYVDASGNVNFTYTGHNAALVVAAIDAA